MPVPPVVPLVPVDPVAPVVVVAGMGQAKVHLKGFRLEYCWKDSDTSACSPGSSDGYGLGCGPSGTPGAGAPGAGTAGPVGRGAGGVRWGCPARSSPPPRKNRK